MDREKGRPITHWLGGAAFGVGVGLVAYLVVEGGADVATQLVPAGALAVVGLALVRPKAAERILDAVEGFGFGG